MNRKFLFPALVLTAAATLAPVLRADVKTEEKTLMQFGGTLGRVMNFFGGKSAKEGIVSTVAVSGNRKMTANDSTGQIVDLAEEKVYDLDMKKKTYTVTTFEEFRRRMEEAEAKAREEAAKAPKEQQQAEPQTEGKQLDVDFDVKNTGQTKTINGFDTHEVVVTVTVREKGKTLEESGGMVMTVDNWLTKSQPALREIAEFDMKYFQKLQGPQMQMDIQQMARAMAMMPGLKEAFSRASKANLDGTAIQVTTSVDAVKSAEQMQQSANQSSDQSAGPPTSIGGALGGFMRRRSQAKAENNPPSNRAMFMTISHEVLKISTSVSAADVAIPAGFKLAK